MLELRRATVAAAAGAWLEVDVGGERAPAFNDVALVGEAQPGDEVVVNVQARRLGLGSGGFHVVHCNLTRGLGATDPGGAHVMKLNYTPLQHAVEPADGPLAVTGRLGPVSVLALHGQLEPVAWAFHRAAPAARLAYVQTAGGALPGALSETVARLRADGLLAAHVTAGPAYGGEREAISTAGALAAALDGCDAVVAGPGPGIVGSATALGHGGLVALDTAHAALALGCTALLVARLSEADPRERHRGISHHTRTVLDLLLRPVVVALPEGVEPLDARHDWRTAAVDLAAWPGATRAMGRDDPLFFAAALAGGATLAELVRQRT